MDDFEKELKEDFLQEATDLIDEFEQVFLDLEDDQSPEVLDKMFRFAHNLKGTSRAVGFGEVAEFTHEVENLILKLKEGEVSINPAIVSLLLNCNDHIGHMINTLKDDMDATFESGSIISQLTSAINGELSSDSVGESSVCTSESNLEEEAPEPISTVEIATQENTTHSEEDAIDEDSFSEDDVELLKALDGAMDAIAEDNSETPQSPEPAVEVPDVLDNKEELKADSADFKNESSKEAEGKKVEATENVVPLPPKKEDWDPSEKKKKATKAKKKLSEDEYIKVALQKVERLNNYVGELILLQTVLEQRRFIEIRDELSNKSISQLGENF